MCLSTADSKKLEALLKISKRKSEQQTSKLGLHFGENRLKTHDNVGYIVKLYTMEIETCLGVIIRTVIKITKSRKAFPTRAKFMTALFGSSTCRSLEIIKTLSESDMARPYWAIHGKVETKSILLFA